MCQGITLPVIARLVLLNGPPGIGKSSVAALLVDELPLALNLDIDRLRAALGQWRTRQESKLVARRLAVVLADAHLRAGHDVVVPQLVGAIGFIEELAATANDAGAAFVELVLDADRTIICQRFEHRRRSSRPGAHPADEIADGDVATVVDGAVSALAAVRLLRPSTVVIDASHATPQETCAEVRRLLEP